MNEVTKQYDDKAANANREFDYANRKMMRLLVLVPIVISFSIALLCVLDLPGSAEFLVIIIEVFCGGIFLKRQGEVANHWGRERDYWMKK